MCVPGPGGVPGLGGVPGPGGLTQGVCLVWGCVPGPGGWCAWSGGVWHPSMH